MEKNWNKSQDLCIKRWEKLKDLHFYIQQRKFLKFNYFSFYIFYWPPIRHQFHKIYRVEKYHINVGNPNRVLNNLHIISTIWSQDGQVGYPTRKVSQGLGKNHTIVVSTYNILELFI